MITGLPYRQLSFWEHWYYHFWPLQIDFANALNNHTIVPGISGTGKTSLLKAMAWEELHTHNALILVDTHLDAFQATLHACIRLGVEPSQCVIIDPTRLEFGAVSLGILHPEPGQHPYVLIDSLLACARGLYGPSFGERMADVMRMLFLTLQKAHVPFTASIPFLTDKKFHDLIISRTGDIEIERFWEHLGTFRKGDATIIIESTRNKINPVLMSPFLKPLFDKVEPTVHFYDACKEGKVILVNLSRNFLKDDSSRGFLGSLLMHLIYNALLQRENDKEKNPVTILCDEVHEYFVPDFFNPMLTGARKYGAGLKMFTQSLGYFKPHDLEIIFSTVGSIISFAVGYADARRLVDELLTFRNDEIVKHQKRDMFGGYGDKTFYSAGEQRQHVLAELMEQAQRELFIRIKKRHGNETYIGRVSYVPEFKVSPEEEAAYRRESARHHGYINL